MTQIGRIDTDFQYSIISYFIVNSVNSFNKGLSKFALIRVICVL